MIVFGSVECTHILLFSIMMLFCNAAMFEEIEKLQIISWVPAFLFYMIVNIMIVCLCFGIPGMEYYEKIVIVKSPVIL